MHLLCRHRSHSVTRLRTLRYTDSDRQTQLNDLILALEALIAHLPTVPDYAKSIDTFRHYLDAVRTLASDGYTQSDLTNASRAFPSIIHTHPHWVPPLIETDDGGYSEPAWFPELERLHTACADAAEILRVLGTY